MNEKHHWTGIAPSARVLAQLDYEEMAVLALLSWSTAANRPVTSLDVASLADRDGNPLGLAEAREIVQHLGDMKVVSVFGMGNERPMSVRVGGFQPRTPKKFDDRRPSAPRASFAPRSLPAPRRTDSQPRKSTVRKPSGTPPWVLKERRVETGLSATPNTPPYVLPEAAKLRERQMMLENGSLTGTLVQQAKARLDVLERRIDLYERWLRDEPRHPSLASVLEKKRKAIPEMKFQIERAAVKQEELEASGSE
ncbi:hypothetical protein SEA_KELA_228 [Streptomyces phage Kela]|nr:hypothetical protein SEA_JUSTBECAUSE_229 [Streptomyces phage JustBecause]QJD53788.1 hypothetical protein SEA_KELA_228 [Streptomyces phage Kela]